KITSSCEHGQADWEEVILAKASTIVNRQQVARGHFPAGAYVSSNKINPDFFTESAETHRANQVRTGMKFLHRLIHNFIAAGMKSKDTTKYDDEGNTVDLETLCTEAPASTEDLHIEGSIDEAAVLSLENLVYVKPTPEHHANHKLATVRHLLVSINLRPYSQIIPRL
ncbi:hypothetical protein DFH28DRAFT_909297, partial [Melampsora americana]